MYTRGQFAVIGKVGRKALRLYHEEGLLVPACINEENGYHYYEEGQLAVLEKIRRLRQIGLSLFEIRQVLEGKADEKEAVRSRITEMDEQLQAVKELAAGREQEEEAACDALPDIRPFECKTCLYIDENVEKEDLGVSVGKLYEQAAREGLSAQGSHFVLYENLNSEEGFSMRTCLPVSGSGNGNVICVSEAKCLHLHFTGGFSKIGKAHEIIHRYAAENKTELSGRAYEVYNKDLSADVYYPVK